MPSSGPPGAGCHARSLTPEGLLQRPLGAGGRNDLQKMINDMLVRGDLAGSETIRADTQRLLSRDGRVGREDRAEQIWQLLTHELWHRNARSMDVAA